MSGHPLRILQVLRAPIGGLYRHVIDLSTALAERGHEIGLVMDSSLSDIQTEERLAGLRPQLALGVHKLPIPRLLGPADLATPLRIRTLARRLDVDVVHGHGAKGGFHARLARLGARKRVAIYTPHGGVLHFDPQRIGGRAFLAIEKALLGATDAVIFESAYARDTYTTRVAAPRGPAPVIHNGLNAAEFDPLDPNAATHDFAYVGELRDLKGVFHLLDALKDTRAPDGRPATLVMAGDGPARDAVLERISALGLDDRVVLPGVKPARAVFAMGRCAVVPSLAESLPYVVMEAAAAGKPVIATAVGGIPEIFGPTSGSLVPPADTTALSGALQRFLDAPDAAEQEAAERLEHVRGTFTVATMAVEIERVYRQAVTAR